jgi:hypothetical protein
METTMILLKAAGLAALTLGMATAVRAAEPVLPPFEAAAFASPKANAYLPLEAGHSHSLSGQRTEDGKTVVQTDVWTVMGAGPELLGVTTIAVQDEGYENGVLVERAYDYFAADGAGNVWYFGEDVTNFRLDEAGRQTGMDSKGSWRTGVNGALPGIVMPAVPAVGLVLYQEHAPGDEAMDFAEFQQLDAVVTGPAGEFKDVIKTYEASTADPDLREFKYWAKGLGMIRAEEDLSEDLKTPGMLMELQPAG